MATRSLVAQKTIARSPANRMPKGGPSPQVSFAHDPDVPVPELTPFSFRGIPLFSAGENGNPDQRSARARVPLRFPLQAKVEIGAVNDPLEHEADRVAERVMRMPLPAAISADFGGETLRRKCKTCAEEENQGTVRRKCQSCSEEEEKKKKQEETHEKLSQKESVGAESASGGSSAPAIVGEVLQSPGKPLDAATRAFFEPRFGYDFGHVRVHTGERAAESAKTVGAQAYAVGSHLVFNAGGYSPATPEGQRLLAHELAHVVQQRGSVERQCGVLRRHATSDCDTNKTSKIAAAVTTARSNIAAVVPKLAASPLGTDMENALWLYFRDSSAATATKVSSNLSSISKKIGDVTYECEDDCPQDEMGYTRLGTMVTGLGHIHLCMNNLQGDTDDIANTIIHEVAHYTLLASDSAGYYSRSCEESETTVSAGPTTKLNLADSYNCFVKDWLTGNATDRANAKADISGSSFAGITQAPAGPIDLSAASPKKPIFVMKLTRGPVAIVTGVSYRWSLRDPQDNAFLMTNTSGEVLQDFKPAVESVLAIINSKTRALLKQRGITSGVVLCRAKSPVFGEKLFELAVTFV